MEDYISDVHQPFYFRLASLDYFYFVGESSIAISMIDSTGSTDNPNVVRRPKVEEVTYDPTVPNDHPILKASCCTLPCW